MKSIKKLLIIIPIICGIALFAVMKMNKKPPVRLENQERVQTVRVISLEKMAVVPKIVSYGYVEADRTWQAIPEVSGKIVFVNENLKKGHFIKKGEVLLKIDTTTYGLAEIKGKADLANVDAKLKELEQSRKNTQYLLSIEKKSLVSAGEELKRKQELFSKEYISASDFEKEKRSFLSHQTAVNNLQNKLNLIPSQEKALKAQKKSGESTVKERRLNVAKTEIRAPFNCRLSVVNTELSQFAAAGTVLIEAQSVDRAEIPVSLTPKDFLTLLPRDNVVSIGNMPSVETIRRAIDITAKVRLPMDDKLILEWDGVFSRISESMDIKTGAITIYIAVDNPYKDLIPGKRPPLMTNMYVEVELKGRALQNRWAVPRSAVHDQKVYICTPENRLEIREVKVEFNMGDEAVISEGFKAGEKLVLTDLVPAIEGMLLKPVQAESVRELLKQQALGETKK